MRSKSGFKKISPGIFTFYIEPAASQQQARAWSWPGLVIFLAGKYWTPKLYYIKNHQEEKTSVCMLNFEDSHLIDRELLNKTVTITLSGGKRDCFRKHYLGVALIDLR